MNKFTSLILASLMLAPMSYSLADTKEVKEAVKETATDAKKAVKKGAHRTEEKACEMVNGKLQCLDDKAKNRAEEVKDEVKDMTN
ncbi:hypothetical protein D3C87_1606580 [compost metagenome]